MSNSPLKLAVLVSGSGTTLQNLIDHIRAGSLDARIELVVGSKPDLPALRRAADAGLRSEVVVRADLAEFSRGIFNLCDEADVNLVCLCGWFCLLEVPDRYNGRVMNIHPALLPSFGGRGMYGLRVHRAALHYGCKVSGCTVHFVDDAYDTGPVILQKGCAVLDDDTPETLAARVFELEKVAYPEAIRLYQEGRLRIDGRRVRITSLGQA